MDLIRNKIITEIKYVHYEDITNIRHFLDKINRKDLILTISSKNKNIKIWDINNWKEIYNLINIYKEGCLNSACIFSDNIYNYIATCNDNYYSTCKIKIINYKLKKMEEINNSNERTNFIDAYYDNNKSNIYIITGNYKYIKSYDYNNNKEYHIYDDNDDSFHTSIFINKNKEITQLIDSVEDGSIRIWDFHLGLLLNKIIVGNLSLYGVCLYNNRNHEYLFVGSSVNNIFLIDLKNKKILNSIQGHNNEVMTVKTIIQSESGDLLISQGYDDDGIKIWLIKN